MDFKYLVDSGEYSRNDLNDSQNAFIDGLEQSLNTARELLNLIQDDYSEDQTMLTKIKLEEMEEFVKEFEGYMDHVVCEHIVVFSDNNYTETEKYKQQTQEAPPQQPEQTSRRAPEQKQNRGGGRYH